LHREEGEALRPEGDEGGDACASTAGVGWEGVERKNEGETLDFLYV